MCSKLPSEIKTSFELGSGTSYIGQRGEKQMTLLIILNMFVIFIVVFVTYSAGLPITYASWFYNSIRPLVIS